MSDFRFDMGLTPAEVERLRVVQARLQAAREGRPLPPWPAARVAPPAAQADRRAA